MSRMREEIHFLVILQSNDTVRVESKSTIERKDAEVPVDQISQILQSSDVPTFTSIQRALDNIQKPQNSTRLKGKLLDPLDQEPVQPSDLSTLDRQGEDAHHGTVRKAAINLVHVFIGDNGLKRLLLSAITRIGKVAFEAKLKEFFSDLSTITEADQGSEWLMKHQPYLLAILLSDKLIPVTVEGMGKQPGSDFDLGSKDAPNRLQRRLGMDTYDVPDNILTLLSDSEAIQRSLNLSEIFSSIHEAFQRDVFLRPGELISRVLSQHLLDETRHKVSCHIEWQLVEYLRQEFPNTSCFDNVFTITGELDMAWGTTMREYMAKTWLTGTGETLCDTLQKILLHKSFNIEFLMEYKTEHRCALICHYSEEGDTVEYADITIWGNIDEIKETIEQFAWLTAIFRRPHPERVTVSDVNFMLGIPEEAPQGSYEMQHFELSLYPVELGMDVAPNAKGQCWTRLFPESIIAYRFPISAAIRESPLKGLAMPFDVMTSAIGIKYPISCKEGMLLAGEKVLLVPVERHKDDVQWHLLQGKERFSNLEHLRHLQIDATDEEVFQPKQSLIFLGYHRYAGVHVGTGEAPLQNVKDSEMDVIAVTARAEKRVGVNAGFNFHGASLGATGGISFGQREYARLPDALRTPDGPIRNAKDQPIILYDDEFKRAFMVSELSVALQMAQSTLNRRELPEYIRRQIPLAEVSADGGQAAHAALLKASKLAIPPEFGSEPRPLWQMVCDYLSILEQRKVQDQANLTAKLAFKDELRAWEYTLVEAKRWVDVPRSPQTRLLEMKFPMWWKFSEQSEILVLVGRGFEGPIRGRHDNLPICNAWPEVPADHDLLVTTIPVLWQARRLLRKIKKPHQGRLMLSDCVAWARPNNSRLFRPCSADNRCRPVQGLRNVDAPGSENGYLRHPGQVELDEGIEGAVILGNDPFKFEHRNCVIVQPPPVAPNPPEHQNNFHHPAFFAFFALLAAIGIVGNIFRDSVALPNISTHTLRSSTQIDSITDNKHHDML